MALRSMTGFGRASGVAKGFDIVVQVRSVNHKGLDVKIAAPGWLANLETRLLTTVREHVNRGRVNLKLEVSFASRTDITDNTYHLFNTMAARAYIHHLDQLRADLSIVEPVRLDHILGLPNVFQTPEQVADPEALWPDVKDHAVEALKLLVSERDREGEVLAGDITTRLDKIAAFVDSNEEAMPTSKEQILQRLRDRLAGTLKRFELSEIPEERLLQEVILHMERCDITEEIIRARAHVKMVKRLVEEHSPSEKGSIGKKMDFYFQEMIREVNTMGSKSQSAEIASNVVEMRSEIDRMREQVLNVE